MTPQQMLLTGDPVVAPAAPGSRIGAYLIDLTLVVGIGLGTFPLADSWPIAAVTGFEAVVVLTLARAATGRTPGSLLVRMVGFASGSDHAPGLGRQSLRTAIQAALHLTVLGPIISAASTKQGQDWADRVAGTAAVSVPRSQRSLRTDLAADAGTAETVWTAPVHETVGPRQVSSPDLHPSRTPVPVPRPESASPELRLESASPAPRRLATPDQSAPVARPIRADQTESAPPLPALRAWAIFDSGHQIELSNTLVLGREPVARNASEQAVPISDPSMSLSRTHLRLGVDNSGVWIEDAFSTNGTGYLTPDGRAVMLTQGQRINVANGTVVLLGDYRLTIAQLPAGS
jgi:hypothetical protein